MDSFLSLTVDELHDLLALMDEYGVSVPMNDEEYVAMLDELESRCHA